MITLRPSTERGHAHHGWLESWHSFSFADYHDPAHVHFRSLRVINEDIIAPGEGFGTHPHHDMEIITYVLSGALAHKDSMGNGSTIHPGHVQAMSAGSGITHSEFNALQESPTHLLQVWIMPHTKDVTPSYGEWQPDGSEMKNWVRVASDGGKEGGVAIHQDARLYITKCANGDGRDITLPAGRYGYLHVARGAVQCGDYVLSAGDAVMFDAGELTALTATQDSELLLFDLA
jgi:hypothetical protein